MWRNWQYALVLRTRSFGSEGSSPSTAIMTDREINKLIVDHVQNCGHLSASHMIVRRPGHSAIVALGAQAIPFLIEKCKRGRGCTTIFLCLRAITNTEPYAPKPITDSPFIKGQHPIGIMAWDVAAEETAWCNWWDNEHKG